MNENNYSKRLLHNLIIENREKLSMNGVKNVDNFDENSIVLLTEMGELTIKGENLHIVKMDVDSGDLQIDGNIFGLIYNEISKNSSLFKRLFK